MNYPNSEWKPGCEPQWFRTSELRFLAAGESGRLQQRWLLQGYGEWPPRADEWRDVPIVNAEGAQ